MCFSEVTAVWYVPQTVSAQEVYPHVQVWKNLLKDYDRRVIPVRNPYTPLNLAVGISIETIIDLDFKSQILTLKAGFYMMWKDEFLVFNESQYHTDRLFAEPKDIWLPELWVQSSVRDDHILTNKASGRIIIYTDGTAYWSLSGVLQMFCQVKVIPSLILVIVGSFSFLLPVDSGDKVSLSVTILLAMTVMVQFIMDNVPTVSSGVPFIGKFIMTCIVLLAMATAMSVVVVNISEKSQADSEKIKDNFSDNRTGFGDRSKWRNVALWLDRLFMVIYLSVTAALVIWTVVMATQ